MSTLIKSGTKKISHKIWSDYRRYYYSELTITGKHPNRKFSIDLFSSESKDLGVALQIGTIDPKTGALTLNSSASDTQQKDKAKIAKETKNSGTYWEGKIGGEGLEKLSNEEKEKLGLAAGSPNEEETGECPEGQHKNDEGICVDDETGTPPGENNPKKHKISINEGFGDLASVSIKGRKARTSYGNYYYPEDLASNKQDRIKFTMGYSEGTEIDATVESGVKSFQKNIKSISGSVTLPIVTGISDQSSVDWKGAELNPLQSFAAAGALDLFNEARNNAKFSDLAKQTGEIFNTAKDGLVDTGVGDAINVWLAQKAVGAQNLLSRTTGAIVNPNLEMLFNAPQLRNFGFTFLLSPRDADEATQVRNIIRFFKQGMSVKTTNSNVFLKAPNIFAIKYMTYNTDGEEILHPSINIIKTCALLSMDVQYTPNGTYMTYEDPYRTMQAYQLTMQFGELDPIYDSDYTDLDNDNDTVIGY